MANIGTVLKQEITRLARKEAKAAIEPLRKASATARRDVAALKREVADLQRQLRTARRAPAAAPAEAGEAFAGLLACPACKGPLAGLGCPACGEAYADDDGVLRLREPADAPTRFSAKGLKSLRARTGLSAADFGRLAGVSGQSIYHWEAGKTTPGAKQRAALAALRGLGKREALRRLEALG